MPHRRHTRHSRSRSSRVQIAQWHDPMVDMLISERRRRNDDYHNQYGRSRQEFWRSVARRFICAIFHFMYSLILIN